MLALVLPHLPFRCQWYPSLYLLPVILSPLWLHLHLQLGLPSGSVVKNPPATQETQETRVRFLSREDSLEKGKATHSSILAWRIPWNEEPGGPQSIGSQRIRRVYSVWARTHACSCSSPICACSQNSVSSPDLCWFPNPYFQLPPGHINLNISDTLNLTCPEQFRDPQDHSGLMIH